MSLPSIEEIKSELTKVIDPEIKRPITELGMLRSVEIDDAGNVVVGIDLTTAGCPLRDTITIDTQNVVGAMEGVASVSVQMGVMDDDQRAELKKTLRGGEPERVIPFAQPGNLTRVYAITSGKGGVGKSSMTVNLATAMARSGLKVGVVDADIYGFSIPHMMGVTHPPQVVDNMIIPPVAHEVKTISIGNFMSENGPVVWRGPMLHRALEQFFADVYWGDLDVLLIDLPPGTGDIALSVSSLIPKSEIVIVTTPQVAAADVAERAGLMAKQTDQRVVGIIENMSYLAMPDGSTMEIFGTGGGQAVAAQLSANLGYEVPLLAQVPIEQDLREGGDSGVPFSIQEGASPAQEAIRSVATTLAHRARGLAGRSLGVHPVGE
ncbi:Mrp/NBP35 family ATP-binding protein [Trueperella pecoris]|uniref:Iron-sulfur cluster carrier protein n=1 Tax=Trueperella pecoris TaxID=2733571 RepID=A0A7M1QYE7_9ACTO|nr:P-loop NTPase [Trueperella pecoris]QOR45013.1 Mrp/NBP35 family ATP-binding protein [Trueperella pecoris]QOR47049.1 Mrp/NBP35 family ATP-binding protein [Trueperella pecoris]QTG74913.1 Mrp/NBP35 family ATP-binding protein [Trueperella pecoris]